MPKFKFLSLPPLKKTLDLSSWRLHPILCFLLCRCEHLFQRPQFLISTARTPPFPSLSLSLWPLFYLDWQSCRWSFLGSLLGNPLAAYRFCIHLFSIVINLAKFSFDNPLPGPIPYPVQLLLFSIKLSPHKVGQNLLVFGTGWQRRQRVTVTIKIKFATLIEKCQV